MNIIAFTSLPREKIELYNSIFSIFKEKGHNLFLIVLDEIGVNIKNLKFKDYLSIISSDLVHSSIPDINNFDENIISERDQERIVSLQCKLFNTSDKKRELLYDRTVRLAAFVNEIITVIRPAFVIRNLIAKPAHEITRLILRKHGISYVDYQAWAYPGTYQYSRSLWNPVNSVAEVSSEERSEFAALLREMSLLGKQKRSSSKEIPYKHPKTYLLYLTGGLRLGASISEVEEYYSAGSGWGDDVERVKKIENEIDNCWPECDLIIRQHPNARPRLSKKHFSRSNTFLMNDCSLDDLLDNAEGVMCGQTTLVYHALNKKKNVSVLGHHELEDCCFVYACDDNTQLAEWIRKVKDNQLRDINSSEVEEAVIKFMRNAVFAVDHKCTYSVFDNYLNKVSGETEIPPKWYELQTKARNNHRAFRFLEILRFKPVVLLLSRGFSFLRSCIRKNAIRK